MDYSDVQNYIRRRGFSTSQVSDDTLAGIVDDVLRDWSTVRGPWAVTTLTTVADTYSYDYPTGALTVVNVHWAPGLGDDMTEEFLEELMTTNSQSPHYPSLRVIRNIETTRWRGAFTGLWEDRDGSIILYPTPDSADYVVVEYRTLATISDIEAVDETLFLDGASAFCMQKVGMERGSTAGWRASRVSVDFRAGNALMTKADKDMSDWRRRLGLGVTMPAGRS